MKKLLSAVLSFTMTFSVLGLSVMNTYAENGQSEKEYAKKFGQYDRTLMYYNQKTNDIYITARQYWHSGDRYGDKYWYYKLNDDNTYSQSKKLACKYTSEGDIFYKDHKECSQSEFENELWEYENNIDLVKIDLDKGMSNTNNEYSEDVDYSYIKNIQLIVGDKTTLSPKIILGSDIDLKVEWNSSNSDIASVSQNGEVTAKSKGECTISAKINGVNQNAAEYTVSVVNSREQELFDNASTEKDGYNALYDYYKGNSTQGHVITDLDGDGKYELVMRSSDHRTINVYKMVSGEVRSASLEPDSDVIQVNLNYTSESCFFTVIRRNGENKYKVKVFEYSSSDYKLHNVFQYECERRIDYFDYTINGNVPSGEESKKLLKYSVSNWQESFNDYCTEVVSYSNIEYLPSDSAGIASLMVDFAGRYYETGDIIMNFGSSSTANGLDPITIKYLALNEIYARHGMKSSNPMYTAFFNKKSYYNADMSPSEFSEDFVSGNFNEYERENIDRINDAQFGSR